MRKDYILWVCTSVLWWIVICWWRKFLIYKTINTKKVQVIMILKASANHNVSHCWYCSILRTTLALCSHLHNYFLRSSIGQCHSFIRLRSSDRASIYTCVGHVLYRERDWTERRNSESEGWRAGWMDRVQVKKKCICPSLARGCRWHGNNKK